MMKPLLLHDFGFHYWQDGTRHCAIGGVVLPKYGLALAHPATANGAANACRREIGIVMLPFGKPMKGLLISNSRVDVGVRNVHREVRKHERDRAKRGQAKNKKMIAIIGCVDEVGP